MKKDALRKILLILGILFSLTGFCLIAFSAIKITGLSISDGYTGTVDGFLGIFLFFTGIFLIERSSKKGQSAIEFLMTYGWAILAAVLALGVLAYTGVFSSDSLGGGCTALMSPPFYVNAQQITPDEVTLEIKNQGNIAQTITEIIASVGGEQCIYTGPKSLAPGGLFAFTASCGNPLTAEETVKGDIEVSYTKPSSTLEQKASGTIKCEVMMSPGEGGQRTGEECGNGIVEGLEACDDENIVGGGVDGCSESCEVEAGFVCTEPPIPQPTRCFLVNNYEQNTCGNGIVEEGEECDLASGNGEVVEGLVLCTFTTCIAGLPP